MSDCTKPVIARGWCWMHYRRWRRHGDPATRLNRRTGVGYVSAHRHVYAERGAPERHSCVRGCGAVAAHWAYDHTDTNELTNANTGARYSLDVERYQPMCVSCHKQFDLTMIVSTNHGG